MKWRFDELQAFDYFYCKCFSVLACIFAWNIIKTLLIIIIIIIVIIIIIINSVFKLKVCFNISFKNS